MDIVSRVKGIILKPKEEWEKIKGESITVPKLFTSYAMLLVAIPAVAQFIGFGIIGTRLPFVGWFRISLATAFTRSIVYYALTLGSVYLLGFIINALAPSFSSKQNPENAMKLAVFSLTPAWVAGALNIIPPLAILGLLAGLYGIYILYLGIQAGFMETPQDKAVTYLVVVIVVTAVLFFVVNIILGAFFAIGGLGVRAI